MDAKVSSPPMTYRGVGGVIVLRGRESRLHGEGRQGIDGRWTNSQGSPWESLVEPVKWAALTKEEPMTAVLMREANPWRAGCGESRMPGSEGGVRATQFGCAPCPYLTN
jgi:hypothetical protein